MAEPLLGKYLVLNRAANCSLNLVDSILSLSTYFCTQNFTLPQSPQRILLSNSAHLGDVLILTTVLPVLKKAFPEAKIGLLIGSWSLQLVQGNPMIDWIHTADHWKLNRADVSMWQKLKRYWHTRRQALREIKDNRYEISIDLYPFFANFIPLLWEARIPVRIGYISGGFGSLLTHPQKWRNLNQHVSDYHVDLLKQLPIEKSHFVKLQYNLPPNECNNEYEVERLLTAASIDLSNYIVIHMGTGNRQKEWPIVKWQTLIEKLHVYGCNLVFTGRGKREADNAQLLMSQLSKCVNACNKISWGAYISIIKRSKLIICLDSLAGHVAGAVDTPCIVIWSGLSNHHHWQPLSESRQILRYPMPCAPCYRSHGCMTMDCVHGVQVNDVYIAALNALNELDNSQTNDAKR